MSPQLPFSTVDSVAIGIILLGAIWGLFRKLSRELFTLVSMISASVIALLTYKLLGEKLSGISRLDARSAQAVALVIVVISVICLLIIIKLLLRKIFTITVENKAERVGGFFAGLISFSLAIGLIFYLLILFPHNYINHKVGNESMIGKTIKKCFPALQKFETNASFPRKINEEGKETDLESKQDKPNSKQKKTPDTISTNRWI
jgi:uncharacterized membrane protein required for colicin V production